MMQELVHELCCPPAPYWRMPSSEGIRIVVTDSDPVQSSKCAGVIPGRLLDIVHIGLTMRNAWVRH